MCKFKLYLTCPLVWKKQRQLDSRDKCSSFLQQLQCVYKKQNIYITMPILESNQTPVNLLGRDALFKLGLHIWCSPEGVYIGTIGIKTQMMAVEPKANVYWIGL